MPNRIIREGILTSDEAPRVRRQHIATSVRREIWALPCAVCLVPFDTKCDHIIPVSKGGDSSRGNIQPLCGACNHAKHNRRSNEELVLLVAGKGLRHFIDAAYKHDTRYVGSYDRDGLDLWSSKNPALVERAMQMYLAFLGARA